MAAPYFLGPTISKRYTTLRDATLRPLVWCNLKLTQVWENKQGFHRRGQGIIPIRLGECVVQESFLEVSMYLTWFYL